MLELESSNDAKRAIDVIDKYSMHAQNHVDARNRRVLKDGLWNGGYQIIAIN